MRNMLSKKGFTLIEVMIVVVVLGIIIALVAPRFQNSIKTVEARKKLITIHSWQKEFHKENGYYAASEIFGIYGKDYENLNNLYSYEIVLGDNANTYTCAAAANLDDDPTIDTWEINERGELTHVVNDIEN